MRTLQSNLSDRVLISKQEKSEINFTVDHHCKFKFPPSMRMDFIQIFVNLHKKYKLKSEKKKDLQALHTPDTHNNSTVAAAAAV